MTKLVHIPRSNPRFGGTAPVSVNGKVQRIPIGEDVVVEDEFADALQSAGIPIALQVIPPGQIMIPRSRYGSRIPIGVNGVISYIETGVSFTPSDAQLRALADKDIQYFSGKSAINSQFRAMGTGIQIPVFSGGATNQSVGNRLATYLRGTATRAQFGFTPFYMNTATLAEVRLPQQMKFQIGVDEPFTQSMTVPPRGIVKWGGSPTGLFDPATSPYGVIASDVYTFSQPRTGWISLFTTLEWVGTPPSGQMPRNVFFSNTPGQYGKSISSTGSLIDAGWAHTVTDLGAETANGSVGYIPFMVVEMVDGTVSVLEFGTSSTQGVGDFTPGSGAFVNPGGDAFRNRGWPSRVVDRKYEHAYANIGVSGDQLSILLAANAFRNRLELVRWLNPTHCLFQHGANDLIAGKSVDETVSLISQAKTMLRSVIPNLRFVYATVGPYSGSNGNWTAVNGGDQTEITGFAAKASDIENRIKSRVGPFADGPFIDITTPTMLAGSAYFWKTDGVTQKLNTADGKHNTGDAIENLIIPNVPSISPFTFSV